MSQLIPAGSWLARALRGARGIATVVTSGGGVTTGIMVSTAVVAVGGAVALTPFGQELMRGMLQNMPQAVRNLPGVETVSGVVPPKFSQNLLGFRAPLDVAVSPDDQFVYVVEGGDDRDVKRLDLRDGSRTSLAPPRTTPGLRKPLSVTVAPNGMVYVVDRLRFVVDIYDRENNWRGSLPTPPNLPAWEPLAVTVDRTTGEIYVTNAAQNGPTVVSFAADGSVKEVFPQLMPGNSALSFPSGIVVMHPQQGENMVILSDSNNRRVVAVRNGREPRWTFGDVPGPSAIGLPRGIVALRDDRLLVVDATDHSVTGWGLKGDRAQFLFRIGSPGVEDGELLFPNGIARASDGRIFITDRDNDRVQIWR